MTNPEGRKGNNAISVINSDTNRKIVGITREHVESTDFPQTVPNSNVNSTGKFTISIFK